MKQIIRKIIHAIVNYVKPTNNSKNEPLLLAIGAMLSKQQYTNFSDNINDYEFKVFSQFGDDGIIQYLIKNIKIENETFIEFGVEDYLESNTRFLMMNNNWSGFVMDGSEEAMNNLKNNYWYWKFCLTHKAVFIDKDNINGLLNESGLSNIGILNIDIDGNDFHVFKAINFEKLNPSIIITEYNGLFGPERPISVPYDKNFYRTEAHYSNLFMGASLAAFNFEANNKGYSLVCSNNAGNNAYFVRNDLLNNKIKATTVKEAFKESKFRESKNKDNTFSFLHGKNRLEAIKGLEVVNVISGETELV
jgi:hypothetical protein